MVTRQSLGWSDLLGIGAALAALLVAGLGLGWLVDRLLHTFPIFLFVGLVLGIVGACGYTYVQMRKFFKT